MKITLLSASLILAGAVSIEADPDTCGLAWTPAGVDKVIRRCLGPRPDKPLSHCGNLIEVCSHVKLAKFVWSICSQAWGTLLDDRV